MNIKQIVGFNIDRGGHLSFLGFGEIENFARDDVYVRNGSIIDYDGCELCDESEWLSGIARLEFECDYNTIYTKYLDDITQNEFDAIISSNLKHIKIYCVEYGDEIDVVKKNYYIDKNEAIKDYDTVTINDFENPLSSSNYKRLQYTSVNDNLIEEFIEDFFEEHFDEDINYENIITELKYCDLEDYCNPHDDFTNIRFHCFE